MQLREMSNPTSTGVARDFRPGQNRDVSQYEVDSELTLYHPQTEMVHILNATAVTVWQLCDGSRDASQIVERVAAHYGVATELVAWDVLEVLEQFRQSHLVLETARTTGS